ncbi:MAG: hypothetical protein H6739_10680 [Alphaproteobacteria bacterium]|nr:hypothetical protein [Alphaproteobacteria bacterium]
MRLFPLVLLATLGCRNKDVTPEETAPIGETGLGITDADGDGYDIESDCDDGDANVNPGQAEVPYDGLDNDCDAATPDDDLDGDGFGEADDCDDDDARVNPDAPEACNGIDDNCDGAVDDGVGLVFYADNDGDGYGDPADAVQSCEGNAGYVADDSDCDDTDPAVNVAADEVCDGIDNDCDEAVDEPQAVDAEDWYPDSDGDGYGDADFPQRACEQPSGYVDDDRDCDDSDGAVHPGADETCDGVDQDCDGTLDEDAIDAATWYVDYDGDGYGASRFTAEDCDQPSGYVDNADDCDDTDSGISPAAAEICNGVDDDCDGLTDDGDPDGPNTVTHYPDSDGDGYGDSADAGTDSCELPSGRTEDNSDCDDSDATVYPGASETCNGVDDDCDGLTDQDDPNGPAALTWYPDDDADGYGDESDAGTVDCALPAGAVEDNSDCDDTDAAVNPGATEVWYDGVDADCDGASDYDADGDGYDSYDEIGGPDCLDTDASVYICGSTQGSAGQTCATILNAYSAATDGVYWLDPDGDGDTSDAWQGYCDMTRNNGGWTLVLNNTQAVSHSGNPTMYQAINSVLVRGGSLSSTLTAFDLWVGVGEWGDIGTYARLEVGSSPSSISHQAFYTLTLNAANDYQLSMSAGTITIGSSTPGMYSYHNGRRLTTYDDDNDAYSANCATYYGHPWWYGSCWSGSFWGGTSHQEAPYWTSSGSDYYAWGAIWLQ